MTILLGAIAGGTRVLVVLCILQWCFWAAAEDGNDDPIHGSG